MNASVPLPLDEYERMIEAGVFDPRGTGRIELIRGRLLTSPCLGEQQQRALDILLNRWAFRVQLPEDVWLAVRGGIALRQQHSMAEPNMAWIVKQDATKRRADAGDVFLILEIVEWNLRYLRGDKADLYAAAGIKDYWIVNLAEKCIEVRREPRDGRYQSLETFGPGAEVRPLAFPEAALPVRLLFPED